MLKKLLIFLSSRNSSYSFHLEALHIPFSKKLFIFLRWWEGPRELNEERNVSPYRMCAVKQCNRYVSLRQHASYVCGIVCWRMLTYLLHCL
jgi:hypothetical protein